MNSIGYRENQSMMKAKNTPKSVIHESQIKSKKRNKLQSDRKMIKRNSNDSYGWSIIIISKWANKNQIKEKKKLTTLINNLGWYKKNYYSININLGLYKYIYIYINRL